jgi:hypothetical protein
MSIKEQETWCSREGNLKVFPNPHTKKVLNDEYGTIRKGSTGFLFLHPESFSIYHHLLLPLKRYIFTYEHLRNTYEKNKEDKSLIHNFIIQKCPH